MPHHPGGINNHGRPIGGARFVQVDPEATGESPLGMKVGEHRIRDAAQAAAEGCVYRGTIDADGQGLRVSIGETFELRFQRRQFLTSSAGEV